MEMMTRYINTMTVNNLVAGVGGVVGDDGDNNQVHQHDDCKILVGAG